MSICEMLICFIIIITLIVITTSTTLLDPKRPLIKAGHIGWKRAPSLEGANPGSTVKWLQRFRLGSREVDKMTSYPLCPENLLMNYPVLFFLSVCGIFHQSLQMPSASQLSFAGWWIGPRGSQKEHINNRGPLELAWGLLHGQLECLGLIVPSL